MPYGYSVHTDQGLVNYGRGYSDDGGYSTGIIAQMTPADVEAERKWFRENKDSRVEQSPRVIPPDEGRVFKPKPSNDSSMNYNPYAPPTESFYSPYRSEFGSPRMPGSSWMTPGSYGSGLFN